MTSFLFKSSTKCNIYPHNLLALESSDTVNCSTSLSYKFQTLFVNITVVCKHLSKESWQLRMLKLVLVTSIFSVLIKMTSPSPIYNISKCCGENQSFSLESRSCSDLNISGKQNVTILQILCQC